jgi:hypothetical protein
MSDEQDFRKLKALTGQYPVDQFVTYRFGLFLKFKENGEVAESQRFESKV